MLEPLDLQCLEEWHSPPSYRVLEVLSRIEDDCDLLQSKISKFAGERDGTRDERLGAELRKHGNHTLSDQSVTLDAEVIRIQS